MPNADKQLTILQWLVTSGAFWDAKVLEGLLQNLKTLLLPLLCFSPKLVKVFWGVEMAFFKESLNAYITNLFS